MTDHNAPVRRHLDAAREHLRAVRERQLAAQAGALAWLDNKQASPAPDPPPPPLQEAEP